MGGETSGLGSVRKSWLKQRVVSRANYDTVSDAGTQRLYEGIRDRQFYVYIMASGRNGTLYTGMTSNLLQRVYQHKQKLFKGFSSKYGVTLVVYYEIHQTAESAITREKQIKKWRRKWKIKFIEEMNPYWKDLYDDISGPRST